MSTGRMTENLGISLILLLSFIDFCFWNLKKSHRGNEDLRILNDSLFLQEGGTESSGVCEESQRGAVPSCKLGLSEIIFCSYQISSICSLKYLKGHRVKH